MSDPPPTDIPPPTQPDTPPTPSSPFSPDLPQTPFSASQANVARARLEKKINKYKNSPESPSLLRLPPVSAEDLRAANQLAQGHVQEQDSEDEGNVSPSDPITIDDLPTIPNTGLVISLNDSDDEGPPTECPPSPRPSHSPTIERYHPDLDLPSSDSPSYPSVLRPVSGPSSGPSSDMSKLFNNPFFSTGDAVKHLTRNQSLSRLDRPTHLHSYRRRLRLADVRNTRDDSNTSNAFADAMFANPHRAQETPVIDDEAEDEEYDVPSAFERRRKRWSNGPIRSSSQVEELYRPILRRSYTDFDTDRKRRRVKSSRGFKRSETPPAQVIRGWSPESSISSEFTSDNSSLRSLTTQTPLPLLPDGTLWGPPSPSPSPRHPYLRQTSQNSLLSLLPGRRRTSSSSASSLGITAPVIPSLPVGYHPTDEPEISPGGLRISLTSLILRSPPSTSPTSSTFGYDDTTVPPWAPTFQPHDTHPGDGSPGQDATRTREAGGEFSGDALYVPPPSGMPSVGLLGNLRSAASAWTSSAVRMGDNSERLRDASVSEQDDNAAKATPPAVKASSRKDKGKARKTDADAEMDEGTPQLKTPHSTSSSSAKGKGKARDVAMEHATPEQLIVSDLETHDEEQVATAMELSRLDAEEAVQGESTRSSAKRRELEQKAAEIHNRGHAMMMALSPDSEGSDHDLLQTPSRSGQRNVRFRDGQNATTNQQRPGTLFQQRLGTSPTPSPYGSIGDANPSRTSHAVPTRASSLSPSRRVHAPVLKSALRVRNQSPALPTPQAVAGPSTSHHMAYGPGYPSSRGKALQSHFSDDSSDDTVKGGNGSGESSPEIQPGKHKQSSKRKPDDSQHPTRTGSRPSTAPRSIIPRTVGPFPNAVRRGLGAIIHTIRPPSSTASAASSADSSSHLNRLFRSRQPTTRNTSTPSLIGDNASEDSGHSSVVGSLSTGGGTDNWEITSDTEPVNRGFQTHPGYVGRDQQSPPPLPPIREEFLPRQNVQPATPHELDPRDRIAREAIAPRVPTTPPPIYRHAPLHLTGTAPLVLLPTSQPRGLGIEASGTNVRTSEVEEPTELAPISADVPSLRFIDPTPILTPSATFEDATTPLSPVELQTPPRQIRSYDGPRFTYRTMRPTPMPLPPKPLDDSFLGNAASEGGRRPTRRASWASAEGSYNQAVGLLPSPIGLSGDEDDEESSSFATLPTYSAPSSPQSVASPSPPPTLPAVSAPTTLPLTTRPLVRRPFLGRNVTSLIDLTRSHGEEIGERGRRRLQVLTRRIGQAPIVTREVLLNIADKAKEKGRRSKDQMALVTPGMSFYTNGEEFAASTDSMESARPESETYYADTQPYDAGLYYGTIGVENKDEEDEPEPYVSSLTPAERKAKRKDPGLSNRPDATAPVGLAIIPPSDGGSSRFALSPPYPARHSMVEDDNLGHLDAEYADEEGEEGDDEEYEDDTPGDRARRRRRQLRRPKSTPVLNVVPPDAPQPFWSRSEERRRRKLFRLKKIRLKMPRSLSLDEELGETGERYEDYDDTTPTPSTPTTPKPSAPKSKSRTRTSWLTPSRAAPPPPPRDSSLPSSPTEEMDITSRSTAIRAYESSEALLAEAIETTASGRIDPSTMTSPPRPTAPMVVPAGERNENRASYDTARDGVRPTIFGGIDMITPVIDLVKVVWNGMVDLVVGQPRRPDDH